EAEAAALAGLAEAAAQLAREAALAQRGEAAADAERQVARESRGKRGASAVRIATARSGLATGSFAPAAPARCGAEGESELAKGDSSACREDDIRVCQIRTYE